MQLVARIFSSGGLRVPRLICRDQLVEDDLCLLAALRVLHLPQLGLDVPSDPDAAGARSQCAPL